MDTSEKVVSAYLEHCAYKNIQYEPDGNVPPDFLVDNQIAVEVRRLNQNYDTGKHTMGLEEVAIPLWQRMRVFLPSLGPPKSDHSWHVFLRFSRPVPPWKMLKPELVAPLTDFMNSDNPQECEIKVTNNFELKLLRSPRLQESFFVAGGYNDEESGGFLLGEMQANLNLCIAEKTEKITPYRSKYPIWWLALTDFIGYGLDEFEQELFRDQVYVLHNFNKVILIDPRDHTRAFEI